MNAILACKGKKQLTKREQSLIKLKQTCQPLSGLNVAKALAKFGDITGMFVSNLTYCYFKTERRTQYEDTANEN